MFFEDVLFPVSNVNVNNPKDGLKYGNMFPNEYKGYRDYKPSNIGANNDLLLRIYELDFAINDLNLYLDLHPDNQVIYNTFKSYTKELNSLVNEYEEKYGPMELDDSNYDSYMWYLGPWVWTKEGSDV